MYRRGGSAEAASLGPWGADAAHVQYLLRLSSARAAQCARARLRGPGAARLGFAPFLPILALIVMRGLEAEVQKTVMLKIASWDDVRHASDVLVKFALIVKQDDFQLVGGGDAAP